MGGTSVTAEFMDDVQPALLPEFNQRLIGLEQPDTDSVGGTIQNFVKEEFGKDISDDTARTINQVVDVGTDTASAAWTATGPAGQLLGAAGRYAWNRATGGATLDEVVQMAKEKNFERITGQGARSDERLMQDVVEGRTATDQPRTGE